MIEMSKVLEISDEIEGELDKINEKDIFGKRKISRTKTAMRRLEALLSKCQSADDEAAVRIEMSRWDLLDAEEGMEDLKVLLNNM